MAHPWHLRNPSNFERPIQNYINDDVYYQNYSREPRPLNPENVSNKTRIKDKLRSCLSLQFFKDFCNETTIHGFNHIVATNRHPMEKIGWAAVTILAALGAIQLCVQQWQRYVASPTVVSLEKDYRTWNNTFMALTACADIKIVPKAASKTIEKLWNVKEEDAKYKYYYKFIEEVVNTNLLTNLPDFNEYLSDETLKGVDLLELVKNVTPAFKGTVAWFNKNSNTTFVNVMTDLGVCYTMNSVVSKNQEIKLASSFNYPPSPTPITCQYVTHPCYLRVEVYPSCISYYVHSPYEIIDHSTKKLSYICPGKEINAYFKVVETKASDDVKSLGIDQRNCRFPTEPATKNHEVYSGNVCRRECRSRLSLKLCGCRPFFYFQEDGKACNISGMSCLSKNSLQLTKLTGCNCLPQCIDATYELTTMSGRSWTGPFAGRSSVKVAIFPPRSRYRRQILFSFEDLVVSFGGAAGLFLGCSFLSGIEIVYFVLERLLMWVLRMLGLVKKENKVKPEVVVDNTRKKKNTINVQEAFKVGERYEMKNFIKNIAEYEKN